LYHISAKNINNISNKISQIKTMGVFMSKRRIKKMESKKNAIIILLISFWLVNISQASVVIPYYGVYKTKEITFRVSFDTGSSAPRMENGREVMNFFNYIRFEIKANQGYQIYNKTEFNYKGRSYYFLARNVSNYFYIEAERTFKDKFKKVTYVTLTYQIRINPNSSIIYTKTFVKKLKIILPNTYSTGLKKIKIEEVR
jgi:hypothetical protein